MVERTLMVLVGGKLLSVQGADDGQKNKRETSKKEQTGGESKTAPKHGRILSIQEKNVKKIVHLSTFLLTRPT
jgi:hypothetical protein